MFIKKRLIIMSIVLGMVLSGIFAGGTTYAADKYCKISEGTCVKFQTGGQPCSGVTFDKESDCKTAKYCKKSTGECVWQEKKDTCDLTDEFPSENACIQARYCKDAKKTCVLKTSGVKCSGDLFSSMAKCKGSSTAGSANTGSASDTKASAGPGVVSLENPIGTTSITEIMGGILKVVIGIMGSLALVVFIVGGVMWMTAAGNAERVKKGTQAMMWASIGIVVIFSSYAIIRLVLGAIGVAEVPTPVKTSTGQQWCLTAENKCVSSDGSCSGKVFTTQTLCEKAKK